MEEVDPEFSLHPDTEEVRMICVITALVPPKMRDP